MSQAVGTDPYKPSSGELPVNGPWLDGTHQHRRDGPWLTYGKMTQIIRPSPASLFVLLDENEKSINDAGFAMTMTPSGGKFLDGPGTYHNFACGIAFADGHSEIHKWLKPSAIPPVTYVGLTTLFYTVNNPDVLWVAKRTSARIDGKELPY